MSLQMKLFAITLDFPDPPALAALCQQATGLEKHPKSDADFAGVNGEHGLFIGLQRVDGYQAPGRPDQIVPQQLHICFKVEETLDQAQAKLLELGAGKPEHQLDEAKYRVLTDPAGRKDQRHLERRRPGRRGQDRRHLRRAGLHPLPDQGAVHQLTKGPSAQPLPP
jgi:hypothetical protein